MIYFIQCTVIQHTRVIILLRLRFRIYKISLKKVNIFDNMEMDSSEIYHMANYSVARDDILPFEDLNGLNYTVFNINMSKPAQAVSRIYCPLVFRFIWYTIITGSLSLLGLAGNTLSIIILQKDKGNEVADLLLQALALADNSLLFTSIILLSILWGSLLYFNATAVFEAILPYFLKYVQPIGNMTKAFAIWMTVLLAVNRYIVIKRPLDAHRICSLWKARLQILTVLIFSIVCNIPRFFRIRIVEKVKDNSTVTTFEETSVGKGSLFHIIYTNVLYTLLVHTLPLILLVFMNVSLILELRKMKKQRSLMNVSSQPSDANITLVMCIIIVIFILCHTPDRVLQGINSFYKDDWWEYTCYLFAICNLLIVINSSSNFLVYYFVRKRFRKVLLEVLCPGYKRRLSEATEDQKEMNGALSALRKLSNSMTEILFRQVDSDNSRKIHKRRKRTSSLGTLLTVNNRDRAHRSQSAGRLVDITQFNTQLDETK